MRNLRFPILFGCLCVSLSVMAQSKERPTETPANATNKYPISTQAVERNTSSVVKTEFYNVKNGEVINEKTLDQERIAKKTEKVDDISQEDLQRQEINYAPAQNLRHMSKGGDKTAFDRARVLRRMVLTPEK